MEVLNADWVFEVLNGDEETISVSMCQHRVILSICDIIVNNRRRFFDREITDDEQSQIEKLMSKCVTLNL